MSIQQFEHWFHLHVDSLTILSGATAGALWHVNLHQVFIDLWTIGNIEGAIIVAFKALIGASVAWGFKRTCNYLTKKKFKK